MILRGSTPLSNFKLLLGVKKIFLLLIIACFYLQSYSQPVISDNGHPEHILVGAMIGGGVSYLVYRKTGNKFKSWLIGAATATALGYVKEAIDPALGRIKSDEDFGYSVLGGIIGASIVFPLKKRKPKETPNISAAFKNEFHLEIHALISD